jgi:hypothetical protein
MSATQRPYYLRQHNIEQNPIYVEKILAAAKRSSRLLNEQDVLRMVRVMEARLEAGQEVQESDLEVEIAQ